jgi:hypothetical protein
MTTIQYLAHLLDGGRIVRLQKAGAQSAPNEFQSALSTDTPLTINGTETTLGTLTAELIKYDQYTLKKFFKERGQFEIGSYLFGQLFNNLKESEREQLRDGNTRVDLRIISDDENLSNLPWPLLNDMGRFVAATGWSVSLSPVHKEREPVELSPSPRILIVMPEPSGEWPDTRAETHLRDLEKLLSGINNLHTLDNSLYLVKTWEEFNQKIYEVKPDILYFYGHGHSEGGTSQLIFAKGEGNLPIHVSASEFTNLLRNLGTNAPALVYINCCLGDAGGLLGIGMQLRQVVPVVITNCSKVYVDNAQVQALDIWRSILINSLPPHEAVAAMRKKFGGEAGALSEVSWMMPVVHCGYSDWIFNPNPVPDEFDLNWRHTLDRVKHTGEVLLLTGTMLREYRQRALTFLWYGKRGQGVEQFYKRLEVELQTNRLPNVRADIRRPDWPPQFDNFQKSVRGMLSEAFEVDDYRKVAEQIRVKANRMGGHQTLVYLRHPPITRGMELYKLAQLKSYLEWLDAEFVSNLSGHVFALIGLAFIVEEPGHFRTKVEKHVEGVRYNNMSFHVLDEFDRIRARDLVNFFWVHKIPIPDDTLEMIVRHIMEVTDGEYEKVVDELIRLRELGPWDYTKNLKTIPFPDEDGDY